MSAEHRLTFAAVPRWWSEKFSSGTTIPKQTRITILYEPLTLKFTTVAHVYSGTTQVSLDILQIDNSNAKRLAIKVNLISTLKSPWKTFTSCQNGYGTLQQSYCPMAIGVNHMSWWATFYWELWRVQSLLRWNVVCVYAEEGPIALDLNIYSVIYI